MQTQDEQKRVLLLMSPATYRAGAFLGVAKKLNLAVVVGVDLPETLSEYWHVPLGLDFADPQKSIETIPVVSLGEVWPSVCVLPDQKCPLRDRSPVASQPWWLKQGQQLSAELPYLQSGQRGQNVSRTQVKEKLRLMKG